MAKLLVPRTFLTALLAIVCSSCGSSASGPAPTTSSPSPGPQAAAGTKIYLMVLENHDYSQIIGNPRLPFLNSLINTRATADSYYANTHPSIGNYFMLTTGQIITNDDSYNGTVSADNLVRELNAAGKSWRVYAQSLPSAGFLGAGAGAYVKKHNPFAYFSDVANDPAQAAHLVPFNQLSTDVAAKNTADFNYLLPDIAHDMHECAPSDAGCTLTQREIDADLWLQSETTALLNDGDFQQRGLLIVTFDEGQASDSTNGGGHIVTVFAGPRAKAAYRSTNVYQHPSLLNLICRELRCPALPGASANAPAMTEFVQ